MINLSIYLLLGIILALGLNFRPKLPLFSLNIFYWLIIFLWSCHLITPFNTQAIQWSNQLHVIFSFHIDGLSQLFSLLISGIGVLVFIYAMLYTQHMQYKRAKLLSLLQLFAIGMLGIVLADDMIVLFLGWEITSITSYLLIQFDLTDKEANQAAFNSLFISVLGGLAMLAGFILLQQMSGSWSIQHTMTHLSTGSQHSALFVTAFCLILLGAITKSAQFPFHFWLTGAMKAPTPVSAYLHSATMVNAGIYLLARFHPLFSHYDFWYPSLAIFGLATMLISSLLSIYQRDLKALLAYTTLFALGSMVYLLASDQWLAAEALVLFLFFHAIYKASAFMLVGTLHLEYETRDLKRLGGITRKRWVLGLLLIITFGAMAGLPPFFGFVMKEMIFEAKLANPTLSIIPLVVSILSSMLIAATSLKCLWSLFVPKITIKQQKNIAWGLLCPFVLAGIIVTLSIMGNIMGEPIGLAANAIIAPQQHHFISPASMQSISLSIITMIGGIVIFAIWLFIKGKALGWPRFLNARASFEAGLNGILYFGRWFTYITQRQSMTIQLQIITFSLMSFLVSIFIIIRPDSLNYLPTIKTTYQMVLMTILGLSAISLIITRSLLVSLLSFTIIGLSLSFFFSTQGAVDVAMTQLLIEILTVVIVVVALRKADKDYLTYKPRFNLLNAIIAIVIGSLSSLILLALTHHRSTTKLADYYIKNSLPLAHGKNVVNVILVDFRALDTLGEVLVVFGALLAIYLLTRKARCQY